jgi:hypothetical protein
VNRSRRRRLVWGVIGGLFGLALLAIAIADLTDADASRHEKAVSFVAVVVVPAVAFAVGFIPLWREARSRVVLAAAGICAVLAALFVALISWGFLLPLSAVLVVVGIANVNRALQLSGLRTKRRLFVLIAILFAGGAVLGLTLPLALLGVLVAVVVLGWNLGRRRRLEAD